MLKVTHEHFHIIHIFEIVLSYLVKVYIPFWEFVLPFFLSLIGLVLVDQKL